MKRTNFINLPVSGGRARVNNAEIKALHELASLEECNLSEAVRLAIRETCRSRGLWPPTSTVRNPKHKEEQGRGAE